MNLKQMLADTFPGLCLDVTEEIATPVGEVIFATAGPAMLVISEGSCEHGLDIGTHFASSPEEAQRIVRANAERARTLVSDFMLTELNMPSGSSYGPGLGYDV